MQDPGPASSLDPRNNARDGRSVPRNRGDSAPKSAKRLISNGNAFNIMGLMRLRQKLGRVSGSTHPPPGCRRSDRAHPHPSAPGPPRLLCGPSHKYFLEFAGVLYRRWRWRLIWRSDLGCMRTFMRSGSGLLVDLVRRCASLVKLVRRLRRRFVRVPRLLSESSCCADFLAISFLLHQRERLGDGEAI